MVFAWNRYVRDLGDMTRLLASTGMAFLFFLLLALGLSPVIDLKDGLSDVLAFNEFFDCSVLNCSKFLCSLLCVVLCFN